MTTPFQENQTPAKETDKKTNLVFQLGDLRAGHWPGIKTPPWLFTESWATKHPELRNAINNKTWPKSGELLVGTGAINTSNEMTKVDIYASCDFERNPPRVTFMAYPKGNTVRDYWNDNGTEKDSD